VAVGIPAPGHAADKKFKIFLSMSYIGNDWQAEAENEFRAMATSQSLRDKADLRIQVAGPDAQRQIQQINSMVQGGADAILVYPISPTALNAVVKDACQRHVIVAAYDSVISEPCAYNVHIDQRLWGQITLAMNGILQGAALVYSNGTPAGFSSSGLHWFMTGDIGGLSPVVIFIAVFVAGSVVLLGGTVFGRRVYAVGNSVTVASLSGVNVPRTLVLVYALSGLCSAIVGVMLTGFSGQASLGMGDEYLLPSIAVVVVGGTLITGGRGHYLGMLGGALLLTALQTLLDDTNLPHAVRDIIFGLVVLGAVLALRERSAR
jgi:ABC-type glucose/galactose transport system permease subunit